MTSNLKAFGLALIAIVVIAALAAPSASAAVEHSFRSSAEDIVLTAKSEGGERITFTAGVFTECTDVTFEGRNVGTIRDTLTVHPDYTSCNLSGGESNVTVDTDGCNFVLDSDTDVSAGHFSTEEHATVALECESAHSASPHAIEITASGCRFAFTQTHASSVEVNQSLRGLRYTNLSNHSGKSAGTVTATVRTIKYTATSGSLCGLIGHGAGTYSSGSYDGKSIVTGFVTGTSSGSTTNGFTWTHGAQVDISTSTPT